MLSERVLIQEVSNPEKPLIDVVFVHGLTGDPTKTWKSKDGAWPEWMSKDHPNIRILTFGYPASRWKKWVNQELDIFELAKLGTELLCGKGVGERPIVFIAHSLGGIVTKLILNHCFGSDDDQESALVNRTVRVMFLATPHAPPALPAVVKHFLPNLSSAHVTALSGQTTVLENIKETYGKLVTSNPILKNIAYYEALSLGGVVTVVPKDCADPGITGTALIPIESDHENICKPMSRDSQIYVSVNRHVRQALKVASEEPELTDASAGVEASSFDEKVDFDRRDLWEKMSSAGREAQYSFANRNQNSFARRYTSLGLKTNIRSDYDLLLEEVEQKFQALIYFPLICKGAPASEVDEVVQGQIIEPLANKKIGETTFGAMQVQKAIYFLTEQCHIRWDSEA